MDKREQILEATADLIAAQGIQNCPMASIAKHAGCGAGTIYRYFKTKEELIEQLYLSISKDMAEYSLQNYPEQATVRERFDHIWGRFYEFLSLSSRNICLLDQLWASPLICADMQHRAMSDIHTEVIKLLENAKETNCIKDIQNELLLTMTFGSLFNIARKQQLVPGLFSEEIQVKVLLDMCWDAISV